MTDYDLVLHASKGERDLYGYSSSIHLSQTEISNKVPPHEHSFSDETEFRAALALILGRDSAVDNVLAQLKASGEYDRLPKGLTPKQAQAFG
jgi:hypothetical protein